jgi:uncharacterized protein with NRDE domain
MCVIFLAFKTHPRYPLILLANRDEFYERLTARAHAWEDAPEIFAGRDLVHCGTWLGVTRGGRFAAVTNYREPAAPPGQLSRGNLTVGFLKSEETVEEYLQKIQSSSEKYGGFNLFVGEINLEKKEIGYFSNRAGEIKLLEPGLYGLSNHLLDTSWHKVSKGKTEFAKLLQAEKVNQEKFFELLKDKTLAVDENLPDTGIGFEREKLLSPIFIETPIYGTRCSTVVLFQKEGHIEFNERVYH